MAAGKSPAAANSAARLHFWVHLCEAGRPEVGGHKDAVRASRSLWLTELRRQLQILHIMRFVSTAKVLARRMLKYSRIS